MINGTNARILVSCLTATAVLSLLGIIGLSALGRAVPEILPYTLTSSASMVAGALGINATLTRNGER